MVGQVIAAVLTVSGLTLGAAACANAARNGRGLSRWLYVAETVVFAGYGLWNAVIYCLPMRRLSSRLIRSFPGLF